MVDIYQRELDIPQKSRPLGLFLFLMGLVLLLIAVFFYIQQERALAKREARPWEKATQTAAASRIPKPKMEHPKAILLLWMTIVILGSLFVLLVLLTLAHRLAQRYRAAANLKRMQTEYVDPWQESANRLKTPPDLPEE